MRALGWAILMPAAPAVLSLFANPDAAVLLLLLGLLLIYTEFNVPGTILPGAAGTLCTMLALFALAQQPISHTALAILLLGVAILLLELKVHAHGFLAAGGILALVYGLAHLVAGPAGVPHVHLATAVAAGVAFGGITFGLGWIAMLARRNKMLLGPQAMLGKEAIAKTALTPSGQVEIRGELWQATLAAGTGSALPGSALVVRQVEGLHLTVQLAAIPGNAPGVD